MDERSVGSRWCWMIVSAALGLGCDVLPGAEKEPVAKTAEADAKTDAKTDAKANAKTDAKTDAKTERAPAGGEAKTAGQGDTPANVGTPSTPSETGTPVVPSTPSAPGEAGTPVVPSTPTEPAPPSTPSPSAEPGAVVTPGTPSEPGAVPPASPPAAPSVLSAVVPDAAAFSEKMQRRLRSTLREQHDARTQLASSVALPQPDGGVVVLALYEYSEFEACVGKSDGSPEARKACANRTDDNERVLAGLRKCTGRGLVRAKFGPPPKSQPAYGGELTVEATRPLAGGCTVTAVRGFTVDDVDGDGQPELAIDVVSKTPQTTFRAVTPYDVFTRTVGWYRADLSPQYESALCQWFTASLEEGNETTARRSRLEDADGDGRADLRIESVDYINDGDCKLDDTGWLTTAGTGSPPYDDSCEGAVETATWRYDPGKDEWIDPASSPR